MAIGRPAAAAYSRLEVDDPTDLGATIVVAQALCLSILNLSPAQKTCPFTNGNKANVSVCE